MTAKLSYTTITSLDGYIADETGNFDWSMPDEEVHRFVNALEREAGTHLYGRRLYEVMVAWETIDGASVDPGAMGEYADIWRAADKIVYSRTLPAVSSARTRIERHFDPEVVQRLKRESNRELTVGGAELAAQALAAGLVDELRMLVNPVIVGGGKKALPSGLRLDLELLEERHFANGVVYLRYRVKG